MHTYVTLEPQAEEIAFLEGSNREKEILNEQLGRVTAFNSTFFSKQFKQGIIDQYFLKYMASMIGWPVRSVRARSERISIVLLSTLLSKVLSNISSLVVYSFAIKALEHEY